MPFTQKELQDDYEEDQFMDKLSKYLEQKYGDDDDIDYFNDNQNNEDTKNDQSSNKLSALEILTMKEDELNKIMPINDNELIDDEDKLNAHSSFKYIPTFSNTRNNKKRSKKRKKIQYSTVPKLHKTSDTKNGMTNNKQDTLNCHNQINDNNHIIVIVTNQQ